MLAALGAEHAASVDAAGSAMTQPPSGRPEDFDRAQLVLEDARERARRIIDQSVAEAQDLLRRGAPNEDAGVRGALVTLTDEVRDLRQRLDRIEALLRRQEQDAARGRSAPTPMPAAMPAASQAGPPVPAFVTPAAPPPPASEPPSVAQPPAPPLAPDRLMPEAGPVTVLVSPVAGFQGLMRVQEALVHFDAVAEAIVEGYAQGEARMRLQLREPITPASLGAGLSAALGQPAEVQPSAGDERTLRVALS